jgi:hypothetical protein
MEGVKSLDALDAYLLILHSLGVGFNQLKDLRQEQVHLGDQLFFAVLIQQSD